MEPLRKLICGRLPPKPQGGYNGDFLQAIDGLGALERTMLGFLTNSKMTPAQN
jgi:hypothetical protein